MTAPGNPVDPREPAIGRRLDRTMRHRLLDVLLAELKRTSAEALARGMSPEQLASQLDERIARLRAHVNELHAESVPTRSSRHVAHRVPLQRRSPG